jgi:hypothetical protein
MSEGVTRRTTLAALAGAAAPFLQSQSESGETGKSGSEPGAVNEQSLQGLSYRQGSEPFIRTRSALEKLREIGSGVRDTGAIGDGRADDTSAIQEIADHFARAGGEWYFPPGVFRTTAPLVWNGTKSQRICGRGKRGVYPGRYDPTPSSGLAVILPVHSGRAAIQFAGLRPSDGSIEVRDLALATLEAGAIPEAAFAWDSAGLFLRNFAFIGCSIHGFTSAFDLFGTGGPNTEMGMFRAHRCTINRNNWIARTLGRTQWNGFAFCDNEAGQNGYPAGQGGIAVTAHNAVISGNCLEGQRDALKLSGGMRGVSVRDNYFEANVGTAAIHLQNIRGTFDIGTNSFLAVDQAKLEHLVLLSNCGHGRALGPYWADGVHKMALPVLGNSASGADNVLNPRAGTDVHGLLRLDGFDSCNSYTQEPAFSVIAKQRVAIDGRELAPWNGRPLPVADYETTGSGAITINYGLHGSPEEWVVMSWLFRRVSTTNSPSDPYVSLSVNGTGAQGSRDYVAADFQEYWRQGEWCLLTAAIKLKVAMSSLNVRLHPYGIRPPPGLRTRYICPVVYLTDSPSKAVPYIDDFVARSVTAPPRAPGFKQGDMLINAAVRAAGQAQFVKLDGSDDNWAYA